MKTKFAIIFYWCLLNYRNITFFKLACQDEDGEGDDDEQEAEYDGMLMEYAGELIACLNKVVPWQQFGPYLAGLMPYLFSRTVCVALCTYSFISWFHARTN